MKKPDRVNSKGLSLLELLVSITVVLILVSLVVFISSVFVNRAKKVRCIGNMRTLHSALSAHMIDVGHWPQMEEDRFDFTEEDFFRFWVEATAPYGMTQETWVCPMDRSLAIRLGEIGMKYYGSYNVTRFDKAPTTPYRWNQPWAMERGNLHGNGVHILMPDGSVHESMKPFYGR